MANWFGNLISKVKTEATEKAGMGGSGGSGVSPQRRVTPVPRNYKSVTRPPISLSAPRATKVSPTFTAPPSGADEMSGIPVFHKGGKVKKTGLALVKKGEVVLTPKQSKKFRTKVTPRELMVKEEEPDKISSLPITATPIAYFVRHGDTDMNDEDVFRGDYDPPLNESGQAQARLLKLFFRDVTPSAIYHSSRNRTRQTIEPLAKVKKLKPILTKELDSLDTGNFAGKPKDKENKKKMKWYREHPDAKIPGGQTVRDFQDTADGAFSKLLEEGSKEPGKPVVAGVHGSIIKELGRYLHGDIKAAHVEPGGVVGVYKLPSGAYIAKPLLLENFGDEELNLDS